MWPAVALFRNYSANPLQNDVLKFPWDHEFLFTIDSTIDPPNIQHKILKVLYPNTQVYTWIDAGLPLLKVFNEEGRYL